MASTDRALRAGIIGCGNISPIYFKAGRRFESMQVVGCADLEHARACATAAQHEHVRAYESVDALLADHNIELIINLTIPAAHHDVACRALEAGKHVYNEKPLATKFAEGLELTRLAATQGLRIGCAPDTFMGAAHQTCRRLIDEGIIGHPVAACAFMMSHGAEGWHPNPEFFYQPGGGPMFDMGPYYLTALINVLGPVRRVTASAQKAFGEERTMRTKERLGEKFPVAVPTHVSAALDHESGAVATLVTSFDIWSHTLPNIEIYGTEGTLSEPDPNLFGGEVRVRRADDTEAKQVDLRPASYGANSRGLGAADMAQAIQTGRAHRANGAMALHVLEIMEAVHRASAEGRHVNLTTRCDRPAPMRDDLPDGVLD